MNILHERVRKHVTNILALPYLSKKIIYVADILFVAAMFTISTSICFSLVNKAIQLNIFVKSIFFCLVINGLFFMLFSTSKGVLRYSSFRDSLRIFLSLFCANIVLLAALSFLEYDFVLSTTIIFLNFVLGFSVIVFYRMMVRLFFDYIKTIYTNKKHIPLLIFGTTPTHISLAKMIRDNEYMPYIVAGFISSDSRKMSQKIMNHPIYSKTDFLTNSELFRHIRALLIISEELESTEKQFLAEKCIQYKIELLATPSFDNWKTDEKKYHKIDKVRIEDLLGRLQNKVNTESIEKKLKGKIIMVTGAAGSIGSEIVKQLCRFDVNMLILCDQAESPLHHLGLELNNHYPIVKKQLLIADVRNYERMKKIFEKYRPQYIYHAAAYKHVPLMEEQPSEAILANVLGTKNMADLAIAYQSECLVMISTDKAVNPSSVMGASKRIAEIYIQCLIRNQMKQEEKFPLRFITTRFGNVLGSNGSVIPLFTKQIAAGGPITVTHPDIIRYFMTISEACNLVLEASCMGHGGEIFVFDMGESIKIKDMAESMIRLSGLEPYKDINIIYTGLRPGEKLYEELLYDKEKILPTHHEKIMISKMIGCDRDHKEIILLITNLIETASQYDNKNIVALMKKIVPEFISQNSIYSLLDEEN